MRSGVQDKCWKGFRDGFFLMLTQGYSIASWLIGGSLLRTGLQYITIRALNDVKLAPSSLSWNQAVVVVLVAVNVVVVVVACNKLLPVWLCGHHVPYVYIYIYKYIICTVLPHPSYTALPPVKTINPCSSTTSLHRAKYVCCLKPLTSAEKHFNSLIWWY